MKNKIAAAIVGCIVTVTVPVTITATAAYADPPADCEGVAQACAAVEKVNATVQKVEAQFGDTQVGDTGTVEAGDTAADTAAGIVAPITAPITAVAPVTVVAQDTIDVGNVNVLSQDNDQDNDTTTINDSFNETKTTTTDNSITIDRSYNRDSIVDADVTVTKKNPVEKIAADKVTRRYITDTDADYTGKSLPNTGVGHVGMKLLIAIIAILAGLGFDWAGRRQLARLSPAI